MGMTSVAIDRKTPKNVSASPLLYYFSGDVKSLVYNGELHIFGGLVNASTSSDFSTYHYRIDAKSNMLIWVSSLPSNTCARMVCVYKGELHLMDGVNGVHYKLVDTTWTVVQTLSSECRSFNGSMVEYHGKLVLFGLIQKTGAEPTTLLGVYDGSTWTTSVGTAPFKTNPASACVVEFEDRLYMFGGRIFGTVLTEANRVPLKETYVYSDCDADSSVTGGVTTSGSKSNGKIRVLQNHPLGSLPLEYATAVELNGRIHIFGGNWYNNFTSTIDNTKCGVIHYIYDGCSIYRTDDAPYPIIAGASVVMNGNIHLFGGTLNPTTHQYICNQIEAKMEVGDTMNGIQVSSDGYQAIVTNLPAILKLA